MKKNLAKITLIITYSLIADYCNAQSERFILNQNLYQKIFPSLDSSHRIVFGANYQINDFERFDGKVIQLGIRYNPYLKKKIIKSIEFGININGYFNQDFYSFNAVGLTYISDWAWDGYNASVFIAKSFSIKESKFFVSISPGINIIKKPLYLYSKGKYSYDNKSGIDKSFSGDLSITWKYKNLESYVNFYTKPINQIFVDWKTVDLNGGNYLLDTTKTYYFRTSTPFYGFSINDFKYGIIYHSKIKSNPFSIYYYSNLQNFAIGVNFTYKRLIINPEYILHPYPYITAGKTDYNAHQGGLLIRYNFNKGLVIKGTLLYSDRVTYSRSMRSEIGVEVKL